MDPLKYRDDRYSRYRGYNRYDIYDSPNYRYPDQIIKAYPPFIGSPIPKPEIKEWCGRCGKSLDYCRCRYEEIHYNYHYYQIPNFLSIIIENILYNI